MRWKTKRTIVRKTRPLAIPVPIMNNTEKSTNWMVIPESKIQIHLNNIGYSIGKAHARFEIKEIFILHNSSIGIIGNKAIITQKL